MVCIVRLPGRHGLALEDVLYLWGILSNLGPLVRLLLLNLEFFSRRTCHALSAQDPKVQMQEMGTSHRPGIWMVSRHINTQSRFPKSLGPA